MKLMLKEIPSINGIKSSDASTIDRRTGNRGPRWVTDRREFIRLVAATGVSVGIASLGVFPPARRAIADHVGNPGHEIKPLPCPGYASDHNCTPACGDSTVYFKSCVRDSSQHRYGWHKTNQCKWVLRKNQCISGADWDGWRWDPGDCGCCCNVVFRCHDGKKRNSSCDFVDNSICKWTVKCLACGC